MTRKTVLLSLVGALLVAGGAGGFLLQANEEPEQEPHVYVSSLGSSWLGVSIQDLTEEKARDLKLAGPAGALVTQVAEDSPAAQAGIQKDDVILSFDGERVRSSAQLQRLVRETPTGRSVPVRVSRVGGTQDLTVKLEARSARFSAFTPLPEVRIPEIRVDPGIEIFVAGRPRLGIAGEDLTEQLADYFGVQQGEGVLVTEVTADSPADKAGMKAGDVIVRVGDDAVSSMSELRRALARIGGEDAEVKLTIVRERREQTVTPKLESPRRRGPRRSAEVYRNPEESHLWAEELHEHALRAREEAQRWQQQWQEYQHRQHEWQREWQQRWREWQKQLQDRIRENALKERVLTRTI